MNLTKITAGKNHIPYRIEIESDEKDLISRAQKGDKSAFGVLYRKYYERIYKHLYYSVGNYHDAVDLTSDTFMKAHKGLARFRGDSSLLTWLFQIATRVAIDHTRKKKIIMLPITIFSNLRSKEKDPIDIMEAERLKEMLLKEVQKLPARQKTCFIWRFIEEKSIRETASIMKIKEGTVKALYSIAISKLQKKLKEQFDIN
jgi:RNA polymerase sigma-70 factor (ECF subfamily)